MNTLEKSKKDHLKVDTENYEKLKNIDEYGSATYIENLSMVNDDHIQYNPAGMEYLGRSYSQYLKGNLDRLFDETKSELSNAKGTKDGYVFGDQVNYLDDKVYSEWTKNLDPQIGPNMVDVFDVVNAEGVYHSGDWDEGINISSDSKLTDAAQKYIQESPVSNASGLGLAMIAAQNASEDDGEMPLQLKSTENLDSITLYQPSTTILTENGELGDSEEVNYTLSTRKNAAFITMDYKDGTQVKERFDNLKDGADFEKRFSNLRDNSQKIYDEHLR